MTFSPHRSMGQGRVSTRKTRGDLVHSECGQVLRVLPFHESHCASSCMHSRRGGVEASPHRVCAGSLHGLFRLTPIREAGARLPALVCGRSRCMDSLLPCTSRGGGCSLAGHPGRIGRHWTYSTIGRHERILRVSGESAGRVANTAGRQIRKMFGGPARQSQFHLQKSPRSGPCSSGSEVRWNRAFKRASNPY